MELTKKALEAIEGKARTMNMLAVEFDCTESTIRRWINSNDQMLTTASALKIIREETGLTDKEILTEQKAKA